MNICLNSLPTWSSHREESTGPLCCANCKEKSSNNYSRYISENLSLNVTSIALKRCALCAPTKKGSSII